MMLINDEPRRKWISIKTDPSSVWSNSLILYKNTSINCVNPAGNIWFKCLENDGNYIYHHEALCLHTRTLTSASPAKKSSHPKNIINNGRGEVGMGRWWCSHIVLFLWRWKDQIHFHIWMLGNHNHNPASKGFHINI